MAPQSGFGATLRFVPTHLPNTHIFLEKLHRITLDEEVRLISLRSIQTCTRTAPYKQSGDSYRISDAPNLYPQFIPNFNGATNDAHQWVSQCNVFIWSAGGGLLRADKRPGNGPALSPVLAVAFMPKVEGQCRSAGQSSTVDI